MKTLLQSLYELLSFITEDAQACNIPGTREIPRPLYQAMQTLMLEIEGYLDINLND